MTGGMNMREIYKNPMLYYVLIPVLVGMWPLLVWAVYLPNAEEQREIEGTLCVEGQTRVIDILRIDPDRPNAKDANTVSVEFSYGSAIDRAANLCKIPSSNCSFQASTMGIISGKKRQEATVKLTNVGIVDAAKFLSTLQSRWVGLSCEKAKLVKKKGMPDQWDVTLDFLYYY